MLNKRSVHWESIRVITERLDRLGVAVTVPEYSERHNARLPFIADLKLPVGTLTQSFNKWFLTAPSWKTTVQTVGAIYCAGHAPDSESFPAVAFLRRVIQVETDLATMETRSEVIDRVIVEELTEESLRRAQTAVGFLRSQKRA